MFKVDLLAQSSQPAVAAAATAASPSQIAPDTLASAAPMQAATIALMPTAAAPMLATAMPALATAVPVYAIAPPVSATSLHELTPAHHVSDADESEVAAAGQPQLFIAGEYEEADQV